ncbi:hypothetical protein [Rhodoblastus sp.]|uniref:hypothetical protein n=1 Tax=Rhodoblastus sp. TaxID=1962975 RepID=UPI003F95270F
MTTKFHTPHRSGLPMAERRSLAVLEDKAGLVGRWRANKEAAKVAARSHTALTVKKYETLTRAGEAELAAAEMAVVGSIMAQGQRVASVLAEDIAAETGAAQVRLTTLAGAERITHVKNRAESYSAIQTRVRTNELSEAEADALNSLADADLAADVERTNARISNTKEFVEDLHGDTLGTLKRAFDHLR